MLFETNSLTPSNHALTLFVTLKMHGDGDGHGHGHSHGHGHGHDCEQEHKEMQESVDERQEEGVEELLPAYPVRRWLYDSIDTVNVRALNASPGQML
eukprot:746648-Hanusia_phi.AAC.2